MNMDRQYAMRTFGIDVEQFRPKLTDEDRVLLFKIREAQRIANLGLKNRTIKNVNGFVEGGYEVDLEFSEICCVAWK